MSYWAMWLVIVILLAIIEFSTVNLVSIWFIMSGMIAMVLSLITDNFFVQFGAFVVIGLILMLLTKPFLEKMLSKHHEKLNLDRILGMEGIVTEEIKKNVIGEVKVDGKLWSAIADELIPVESIIKVEAIDGVKLVVLNMEKKEEFVKPVKEEKKTPVKKTTAKKTTTTKKKASTTKKANSSNKKTTTPKKINIKKESEK